MNITIIIAIAIAVFCNQVLFLNLDKYKELNNGFEFNSSERSSANIWRIIILITVGLSIFCHSSSWVGIVAYAIGWFGSVIYSGIQNDNTDAYIIFFGKFLKPILLITVLIMIFV